MASAVSGSTEPSSQSRCSGWAIRCRPSDSLLPSTPTRCLASSSGAGQPVHQIGDHLGEAVQAGQRQIGVGGIGDQVQQVLPVVLPLRQDPHGGRGVVEAAPGQHALGGLDPAHGTRCYWCVTAGPGAESVRSARMVGAQPTHRRRRPCSSRAAPCSRWLSELPDDAYPRPTVLAGWDVRMLVAHLVLIERGTARVLGAAEPGEAAAAVRLRRAATGRASRRSPRRPPRRPASTRGPELDGRLWTGRSKRAADALAGRHPAGRPGASRTVPQPRTGSRRGSSSWSCTPTTSTGPFPTATPVPAGPLGAGPDHAHPRPDAGRRPSGPLGGGPGPAVRGRPVRSRAIPAPPTPAAPRPTWWRPTPSPSCGWPPAGPTGSTRSPRERSTPPASAPTCRARCP